LQKQEDVVLLVATATRSVLRRRELPVEVSTNSTGHGKVSKKRGVMFRIEGQTYYNRQTQS
jgi:hypothetical protein